MFDWLFKTKYTSEEVEKLIQMIKAFNAGAVDAALSKHIDEAYKEWKAKE
tara:strand:+ start:28161 stop:28310 length:150 start_codon:yes stop_codon:yes gene_type:complete